MVASGNDFVIIEDSHQVTGSASRRDLIKKICDRKYGIGADGLLILEKSRHADVRMRIFNPDGSEAEMCGNGARCVASFVSTKRKRQRPTLLDASASRFLREVPISIGKYTRGYDTGCWSRCSQESWPGPALRGFGCVRLSPFGCGWPG